MKLNINQIKSFKVIFFTLLTAIAFYACEVNDTEYEFVDTGLPVSLYSSQSIGLEVSFSNESSHSSKYVWDFGEGSTSDLDAPVHLFPAKGKYTVTLTASDNNDVTNSYFSELAVGFPVAGFTFEGNQGTVVFTNTSNNATSYIWGFGDGGTSTEENPTHIYASGGNYKVTLTAINGTDEDTLESDVFVNSKFIPTILSPGFEDSADWKTNWNTVDVGGTTSGLEGRGSKFKNGIGQISQMLAVSDDNSYTISCYVWKKNGAVGVEAIILAEDGITVLKQSIFNPAADKDWQIFSISFSTETSKSITVLFKNIPGSVGENRFDNVTIE